MGRLTSRQTTLQGRKNRHLEEHSKGRVRDPAITRHRTHTEMLTAVQLVPQD